MDMRELKNFLKETGEIVETHKEEIIEKGEDFNVFSVLGMETSETKTHSAFIKALLNPIENHYYNEKFLALFLQEIGYDYTGENLNHVKVKTEHYLGKISKNYESGGSIDILITFQKRKPIVIENKIYAKDQPKQLYRYSLYKGGNCTLYYLNLFGKPPSKESLHTLTDSDFETISYNSQILQWLEQCLCITKTGSIVENAIKQYQILIKRLTNTMDKPLEDNLNKLIASNLEEAQYINAHYQKTVDNIREKFRASVIEKINLMGLEVKASKSKPINNNFSKIWLNSELLEKLGAKFGIESFSGRGHNNGRIFIGIFDKKNGYNPLRDGDYRINKYWPIVSDIKTPDQNPLNLGSIKILVKLSSDATYFEKMVSETANQTKLFVESYYSKVT